MYLIAEEGPHKGLVLNLDEGEEWILGRDPDEADFVIEDSTVSRKHARLNKTKDGVFLVNMSRVNPSTINEEEHDERILLKEGDRIQIGNTVFLFSEGTPPKSARPSKKKKEKKKKKESYDDIFGSLDEAPEELPPPPEKPSEEPLAETEEEATAPEEPEEKVPEPKSSAYDTIFEDTDEELPFNLISETPFLLKVISGPNAGAEIGIEKGRTYILGKDSASCDIVFQDLSVSRNHAQLSVNAEGQIEIEDLGSKNGTVVNGTPIAERTTITSQDMVALGTTVFLIIDREAPQETIYSPLMPSYETQKSAEAAEEEKLFEPVVEKPARDWKREPIPMKHLVAAASFVLVFGIVFLSFFSLFKSNKVELAHKEPVDAIKEALKKYDAVQFSFNPGSGKLFLVGHVQTGVDYQEMNYRISQIDFVMSTDETVVIDEYVSKMMNDVLSGNAAWRGVSIQSPSAGKFVINGYIQTNDQAVQLADYLNVNFPYLDRLQNNVAVEENLTTQIQSLLMGHQLGAVTYLLNNGDLVLSGRYSNKMMSEYKSFMKEVNAIKGISSVKDFATATSPDQASIDLTQQYQVTGSSMYDGRGYSSVINGRIYTLGDSLDGMKVTSIESNTILLEKDGLKYKIDYTR